MRKGFDGLSGLVRNEMFNLLIDNNQVENAIRPLALERKNYLFAGSHQSAQRIAMMYTNQHLQKMDINPQDIH